MKKGQAAMEFLMTYGWAIIVVLLAIGALAYFGVLRPERIFGGSCILVPGLSCEDFKVNSGSVTLVIRNGFGVDMTDVDVSLSDLPEGVSCSSGSGNNRIDDGASETYIISCLPSGIPTDTIFKATINLEYTKEGFSLVRTAFGSISTGVESCGGVFDEGCSQTLTLGENSFNNYSITIYDNSIKGGTSQDLNYGEAPILSTLAGGTTLARILIKPTDIASVLGPNKVITSAKLNLYATSQTNQTIGVYRILRDWGEGGGSGSQAQSGESSWTYYSNPNMWETPGADGANDRNQSEETTLTLANGWNSFDITNAVTKWYTGEWPEQGLILIQTSGTGSTQFKSSESPDDDKRPYLEIDYYIQS